MPSDNLPTGRHGLTPEEVRDNQRRRLIAATAVSMADKGYVATSVADIIKQAGVSRKTFYEIFGDKADAFSAAYEAGVAALMQDIADAVEIGGTWHERVVRGLTALAESMARSPAFAIICIKEVWAAGDSARQRHLEVVPAFRVYIEDISEELGETLFGGIVGGLSSILFREIDEGRLDQIAAIVPDLVNLVELPLEGLRARARDARTQP